MNGNACQSPEIATREASAGSRGIGPGFQEEADQGRGYRTKYHYDAAGRVIAETGPDGAKRRDYIYLGNKLIAVDSCATGNSPTCTEWYHTDGLGSVAARTNGAGTIVAQLDYQPWGEQWLVQGDGGDRQYNGRVFDPGTGFHDYGARMYWPEIGRFISADSVMGSPGSPMTLNRYSYVLNNPYKYTDPSGNGAEQVIPLLDAAAIWCMDGGCQRAFDATIGFLKLVDSLEAARQQQAQQAQAAPTPAAAAVKPTVQDQAQQANERPKDMSPPGSGRQGAFNEAKRHNKVPTSQQPQETGPNLDRDGKPQPGRTYTFKDVAGKPVKIRDDAAGHNYGKGDPQNRGPHFNDQGGNHYDYPPK